MRCPLLWGYPKLSSMENFRMFPYKPSTLGYPIVGNPYNGRVAALQDNLPNLLRNIKITTRVAQQRGIFMHFPHKVSASTPQCFFGDFTAKLPEISDKKSPMLWVNSAPSFSSTKSHKPSLATQSARSRLASCARTEGLQLRPGADLELKDLWWFIHLY